MASTAMPHFPLLRGPAAASLCVVLVLAAAVAAPAPVLGATTFVVNRPGDQPDMNLADAACDTSRRTGRQCTLRAAIQEANDTPGVDRINFRITTVSKVIRPRTPLPPVAEQVFIDGYSQPGTTQNTSATGMNAVLKIVLDGIDAGWDANGLTIEGRESLVRGLVIRRFAGSGIVLDGNRNVVHGNFIGTNAGGTQAAGNGKGITVVGVDNQIGGAFEPYRNVISGNTLDGVRLVGGSKNDVSGNLIGTAANGTAGLGNGVFGVFVTSPDNFVGTSASNTIGYNGAGIYIFGAIAIGNAIERNSVVSNTYAGIIVTAGRTAIVGNSIATNGGVGVSVIGASEVLISHNTMTGNGGLAIDLQGGAENSHGVTANDAVGDADDGPNGLQNFPEIVSAHRSVGTAITIRLESAPNRSFFIDIYRADGDTSGHGEGAVHLARTDVTTDLNGIATKTVVVSGLSLREQVTAIAIDPSWNTSEFSPNRLVVPAPRPV